MEGIHLHRIGHVGQGGSAGKDGAHLLVVGIDIAGHVALGRADSFQHQGELARLLAHLDHVIVLELV